jgi:predicted nucleic-acid-binding Zn-ribbon protein
MPKAKIKPGSCEKCAGPALTRKITAYPVRLTGPGKLAGKEIQVQRVALYECQTCGYLMPTPAGMAKVARCVQRGIDLFLGNLR